MNQEPSRITELEQLFSEAKTLLDPLSSAEALEGWRVRFLGRKGPLSEALRMLPQLPPEERARVGKRANEIKAELEGLLSSKRTSLKSPVAITKQDVSLPGSFIPQGRLHPITQTLHAVLSIFIPMGFEVVEGPEVEFEAYNFDALNIPQDHPSRESFDTFFVDLPSPDPRKGRLLLRSHTSPVQIRVMEKRKPPSRIVVPGRVFRRDAVDAAHSFMFHQVEGLMVDSRSSFSDLKGILQLFLEGLFGKDTKARFRPHYFPFTEPSAEVDIQCACCKGAGCSTCGRKGWIEIMGAGMVHPNVLKGVGYDPQKVQGFAFGMGIERIAMLKYGISDIRLFFENDLRFLEQF